MDSIQSAVMELAEKHFGNFRIRDNNVIPEYCPFCNGGDSHDKQTFGVNRYNGAYNCFRGSCGAKGGLKQLMDFFGEKYELGEAKFIPTSIAAKKVYDKPDEASLLPLTEEIITYFATRRISEETLEAFKVSSDTAGNIVFPFYRDGILTYIKYRKPRKYIKGEGSKEWQMNNTEPILFGMDNVSFNTPLIITEGEIDALSVYEAGAHNVVSVPCGCKQLDWVNSSWDWLEKFSQIILFGDSDEPGLEMMSTLVKRLGEDRCMIAPPYPQLIVEGKDMGRICKDANEILYVYGPEVLKKIIDSCEPAPVEGVLNLADIVEINPLLIPRIYSRINDLDRAIAGFAEGSLTVISGKRGEGKSTISGTFLLNAIQQDYPVAAFSGELPASMFRSWIYAQACERKYMVPVEDERTGKVFAVPTKEVQLRISDWLRDKFYLFDNSYVDQGTLIDSLLRRFTLCARRFGCKMFLVDNLMMLTSGNEDEYKLQAKITAALKQFAVKYKVAVILVAHPRKTPAGQAFNSEDIAGSAAITNLADTVMSIEKPNVRVTKNREFGDTPLIYCDYDPANHRIYQSNIGDRIQYGWDHTGIEVPENNVFEMPEFAIQHGNPDSNPF